MVQAIRGSAILAGLAGAAIGLSACAAVEDPDPVADPDAASDAAAIAAANAALDPAVRLERPTPGAAGIGDPLYPTLGNGGYEVEHYALHLGYETADPLQPIDGTVWILARATQALSRFDLDFGGDSLAEVRIDGVPAAFARDGDELVITPRFPIFRGELFLITVSHFVASPQPIDPSAFVTPFFVTPSGSGWALQPNNAHLVFPCNDHPSDKATFTFEIDVPEGTTAVANGALRSTRTFAGRTIYRYDQAQPLATELAQVVVGAFTVIARGDHNGIAVRDVVATSQLADLAPKLAVVTAHLDFMVGQVGDYPFDTYGSLVGDARFGFALETQTLSLYSEPSFERPATSYEPVMVHELAHQWFGDSVSPAGWSDVWANEGHATWYEDAIRFGLDTQAFEDRMHAIYASSDRLRAGLGPVADPPMGDILTVFNTNVYQGGALTLFALRQQVGAAVFQDIERSWVSRFRGTSASTADFIALASEVSGQDLSGFLHDWLHGTVTPPMPGHPDWITTPVPASASAGALGPLPLDADDGLLRR